MNWEGKNKKKNKQQVGKLLVFLNEINFRVREKEIHQSTPREIFFRSICLIQFQDDVILVWISGIFFVVVVVVKHRVHWFFCQTNLISCIITWFYIVTFHLYLIISRATTKQTITISALVMKTKKKIFHSKFECHMLIWFSIFLIFFCSKKKIVTKKKNEENEKSNVDDLFFVCVHYLSIFFLCVCVLYIIIWWWSLNLCKERTKKKSTHTQLLTTKFVVFFFFLHIYHHHHYHRHHWMNDIIWWWWRWWSKTIQEFFFFQFNQIEQFWFFLVKNLIEIFHSFHSIPFVGCINVDDHWPHTHTHIHTFIPRAYIRSKVKKRNRTIKWVNEWIHRQWYIHKLAGRQINSSKKEKKRFT